MPSINEILFNVIRIKSSTYVLDYLDELKEATDNDNRSTVIEFEKEEAQHAVSEEEVYFPATIMVGEYLKLKSELKSN